MYLVCVLSIYISTSRICYSIAQPDFNISGGLASTTKYSFMTASCCGYTAMGKGTSVRDCLIIPGLSKATGGSGAGLQFNAICGGI